MKTPVEPTPLVSDKEITRKATIQSNAVMAMHKDDFAAGERARGYVNGAVDIKDVYESDRAKLIAERDELVEALRLLVFTVDVKRADVALVRQRLLESSALLSKYK